MTWLLVEDDPDIRMVVGLMMTIWGEQPLPLPDGNAAWAWLDSIESGTYSGDLPELALMDIRMPGYTGDKIAERIRNTTRIKDIPIVLMTAFSLTGDEVQTLTERTKIDKLINKPLPDVDELRATLYRVRDERKEQRNSIMEPAPAPNLDTPKEQPDQISSSQAVNESTPAENSQSIANPPTTPTLTGGIPESPNA